MKNALVPPCSILLTDIVKIRYETKNFVAMEQQLLWPQSMARQETKKFSCQGTAVTMATNAYCGTAKYNTLCMIVTHLQRKTCCYTVKEKMSCNLKVTDNR